MTWVMGGRPKRRGGARETNGYVYVCKMETRIGVYSRGGLRETSDREYVCRMGDQDTFKRRCVQDGMYTCEGDQLVDVCARRDRCIFKRRCMCMKRSQWVCVQDEVGAHSRGVRMILLYCQTI